MNCCEFRENYSDFADGLLDEAAEISARRHLGECAQCRRFDAAFHTGVGMLRDMPAVAPSRCFGEALHRRIMHEAAAATPALRRWSGAAGAMLVVTAIGVIGWDYRDRLEVRERPRNLEKHFVEYAPTWGMREASALRFGNDTVFYPDNPFRPVPIATDTQRALYAGQLRFETTAVWSGR